MTTFKTIASIAALVILLPAASHATTLAGGYYPQADDANRMCLTVQSNCSVGIVAHPSRLKAARLQADRLGIVVTSLREDNKRARNLVTVTGPGGFGEYVLSDGCVQKITTNSGGIECEAGEVRGTACKVQNNEMVTAAYSMRAETVSTPAETYRPYVAPATTTTYSAPAQAATYTSYAPQQVASFTSNYQRGHGMHWKTPGLDTKNKVITDLVPDTSVSLGINYQINPDRVNVSQSQYLQPGAPYVPPGGPVDPGTPTPPAVTPGGPVNPGTPINTNGIPTGTPQVGVSPPLVVPPVVPPVVITTGGPASPGTGL